MHEELYLEKGSKVKYAMLAFSLLLIPFSFFEAAIRDGVFSFSFRFNTPLFVCAAAMGALYFEKLFQDSMMRFFFPYGALLVSEFFRFGTVSIFGRSLPFDVYVVSAFFMLAAFGYSFIFFFIGQGKMRTRLWLWLWSALMCVAAALSLSLGFLPFCAYDGITEGVWCVAVSDAVAFLILLLSGVAVGVFLKDDKVKKERAERKARKREEKRGTGGQNEEPEK